MIVPSKKKRKAGRCKNVVKLESLKQLNLNAAGLDIGSAEIWACVPEERDEQPVRRFRHVHDRFACSGGLAR